MRRAGLLLAAALAPAVAAAAAREGRGGMLEPSDLDEYATESPADLERLGKANVVKADQCSH